MEQLKSAEVGLCTQKLCLGIALVGGAHSVGGKFFLCFFLQATPLLETLFTQSSRYATSHYAH